MTPTDVEGRKESPVECLTHARLCLLQVASRLLRAARSICAGDTVLQAKPELWDRVPFAAKLKSLEEAPEPLRSFMVAALEPRDTIQWLIFGPTQRTIGAASPASLFAILEREWIVVVFGERAGSQVYRCDFAGTLLIEITDVLLYGRLQLDFVKDGRTHSVAILFNTVTYELYWEAVQILLSGVNGRRQSVANENTKLYPALKALPLKFQNGIVRYLPVGQEVLELVHWTAAQARRLMIFWQELAPEGVLVLTKGQLLFISEEKAWSKGDAKYGYVVRYCPLSRVHSMRLRDDNSLDSIDVEVRAHQSSKKLKIDFPGEEKPAVAAFVNSVNLLLHSTRRHSEFHGDCALPST
jgi:hypothetical protein